MIPPDNQQLQMRARDLARRSDRLGRPLCGRFVSGPERGICLHEAHACGVEASFDGGWPGAERAQCCFHPADV